MWKGTKVGSWEMYDSESKLGERKGSGLNQRGSEKRFVVGL